GRTPADSEVAAELAISVAELRSAYGTLSYTHVGSIDEMGPAYANSAAPGLTFLSDHDMEDPPEEFLRAVHQLPDRDRVIVALSSWDRFTLAAIGLVLGVSESRVSQLHTRAMLTLRRDMSSPIARGRRLDERREFPPPSKRARLRVIASEPSR